MERINFVNNETKASAETFNLLQDNIENAIDNYSTDEVKIGTWINGKPIYRKVINTNVSNGTVVASNVDSLVTFKGTCFLASLTRAVPYYELYNGNSYIFTVYNSSGSIIINAYDQGSAVSNVPCSITLEYTKTTD